MMLSSFFFTDLHCLFGVSLNKEKNKGVSTIFTLFQSPYLKLPLVFLVVNYVFNANFFVRDQILNYLQWKKKEVVKE